MNISIKKKHIRLILICLGGLLLAQITALFIYYKLDKLPHHKFVEKEEGFFELYNFSKVFDVGFPPPPAPPPPQTVTRTYTEEQIVYDTFKITAAFSGEDKSFIMIESGNKSDLVDVGAMYKIYKVVQIMGNKVRFSVYGQNHDLIVGENGKLPRKEMITKTVTVNDGVNVAAIPVQRYPKENLSVTKTELQTYTSNYQAIWSNIKINEVVFNGKISGYRVNEIRPESVFGKLGLQVGDIILSVNNKTLKSNADAFRLYRSVNKYRSLKITVNRNNTLKDLEYEITR